MTSKKLATLIVFPFAALLAQADTPHTGREVLERMHAAYDGQWYRTLSFAQKTVRFTAAGERRAQSWHEYLRWTPERGTELRIDIGDASAGNNIRYTADSSWRYSAGKLAGHDANGNAFLPLIEGVYVQPVERTIADLASTHVDLSKVSTQTWNGRSVWVVGALAASDTLSPQFWVDPDKKILVRMILSFGAGRPPADVRLDDYVIVTGGMLATRVTMLSNGLPLQTEEYADWKTGAAIPDSTFAIKPLP
ncbi:MAG TPA: hypothetical protein VGI97_12100 [Gemmatimonadaceae bacterium]|jgi:hypothetical protein